MATKNKSNGAPGAVEEAPETATGPAIETSLPALETNAEVETETVSEEAAPAVVISDVSAEAVNTGTIIAATITSDAALDEINARTPLVTCLCLTRNRRNWLKQAIACFLLQTYPNRELLIVADSDSDVEGLIPELEPGVADKRIRVLITGPMNVGAKRNRGCDEADGDIIAIWDDDDYSAPGRLAFQVNRLRESKRAVHGFHAMKFTDGDKWWQYTGGEGFPLATSLVFLHGWWEDHDFAQRMSGQDEDFVSAARTAGQLVEDPDLNLMYATIHNGNTSPRPVHERSSYQPLPDFVWPE